MKGFVAVVVVVFVVVVVVVKAKKPLQGCRYLHWKHVVDAGEQLKIQLLGNFLWIYISEADAAAAAAMRSAVWYFNSFCSNSDKNFMSWNLYIFYLAHSIVVATGAAAAAADVAATTYKLHNATNTSAAADCLNRFGWLAVSLSDLYSMYFSVCLSVGMYVYKYRKITCNTICLCVCTHTMHANIWYIVNIFHIYIYISYIFVCVCVLRM